ncbi:hypothetical protein ACF0H2_08550 [Serratia marcescens]
MVIGDFIGIVAEREEQAVKAAQALQVSWKDWRRNLPQMTDVAQALRDNRIRPGWCTIPATWTRRWRRPTGVSPAAICGRISCMPRLAFLRAGGLPAGASAGLVRQPEPAPAARRSGWLLEYPEAQIEIVRMEAAGCYGRNCADDVCADAALLSRAVGRPVRVQLTREQEHVWEPKGTAQLMEVDGGLDARAPVAYDFRTYYPSNGAPTLALLLTGRVEPLRWPMKWAIAPRCRLMSIRRCASASRTWRDRARLLDARRFRLATLRHESYIDELATPRRRSAGVSAALHQ